MKSPSESQPDIKPAPPREEVREVSRTGSGPSLACSRLTCRRRTGPPWRRHSEGRNRDHSHTQNREMRRGEKVALTAKVRVGADTLSEHN